MGSLRASRPARAAYKRQSAVLGTASDRKQRLDVAGLYKDGAKVVVLGSTGVGKTTMVTYLCTETFESPEPTVGASFASRNVNVHGRFIKLCIWDTAGQEKYRSLAKMYYRDAHAAILVYSHTDEDSFDAVKYWFGEVSKCGRESVLFAVVGNKSDLIESNGGSAVDREDVASFVDSSGIHIMKDVSSQSGQNLEEVFESLGTMLCMQAANGDGQDGRG